MILVFIFLSILVVIAFLTTIIVLSTINIQIQNMKITNLKNKERNGSYKVKIKLLFLGRIPIFWTNLNSKKMRKLYSSKKLEKIDYKKIKNKIPNKKYIFRAIKMLKVKLKSLNLRIDIGTIDVVSTSYIVGSVASIISILLPFVTNKKEIKKIYYKVNPIYNQKNEYNIELYSIIQIKIVHIICSMLYILKKGSKKDDRSSNRRTYAYSNE